MRKFLSIFMISALLACCTACGKKDVSGEISEKEPVFEDIIGNDEEEVTDVSLMIGLAEGDVYENEFLGVRFTLPEGWTFYTKEQINEINNITADMVEDDIAEVLENADVITDMYASDQYGNTVNINFEKLSGVAAVSIDEETYLEIAIEQLDTAFEQMGYDDVNVEMTKLNFLGEERAALNVECKAGDYVLYEKLIAIKVGGYISNITVATSFEDATDTVLTYFEGL